MIIKSLIVVDESGKEYAFTHRSLVEVKEYEAAKDPEVQGVSLQALQSEGSTSNAMSVPVEVPEDEPKVEVKSKKGKK